MTENNQADQLETMTRQLEQITNELPALRSSVCITNNYLEDIRKLLQLIEKKDYI